MARVAMIMAGGHGTRMGKSGVAIPKAIVPVAGVPMIEHNFNQLLHHGFEEIILVTPAGDSPVTHFAKSVLLPKAEARSCHAWIFEEIDPLGNIGAVQILSDRQDALIVYADNLTTLDLSAILNNHRNSSCDMTIAIHRHPFKIPYGEVAIRDNHVVGYDEKPTIYIDVCSAISVVTADAVKTISPGEKLGLSDLVRRLLGLNLEIGFYRHEAAWIDVNDRSQLDAAELLVRQNPSSFERRDAVS